MYSLKERLIELLINNKAISKAQLDKALKIQKDKGGSLKNILVQSGFITEKDLMSVLSQGLGIPPISLVRFKIDQELIKLIPREVANKYQIMPVSRVGNMLTVAMSDPLNIFAIDDLRAITKLDIGIIIAFQKEVQDAIDQYYGENTRVAIEELMEDLKAQDIEFIQMGGAEEKVDSERLFKLVEEAPVVKLTNMILENGIKTRSSDILIEPMENSVRVRYRVDGVLKEAESLPKNTHESIVSRIKVMSELNIAERRLPQDGRFRLNINNNNVDFRVCILPSSQGEKVALRVLDKSQAMLDIDKLGFSGDALDKLKKCASRPHGMILVTGPTGSGKTTTLYSLMKYVYSPEKNLITVEDPIEYQIEGINQVTARAEAGLTFASALRSILRQDPDVIMIGEIRDFDTVDIAIKSALTGHLVLSTLHTTTAPGSVVRLVNMGCEPFLITSSLIAIVAQRLIRKLCPKCREAYKPGDVLSARLGIDIKKSKDVSFYRAKGCSACLHTGYAGRVGICEVLAVTPAIRDLVLKRARENELKQVARNEGMRTLREDGIEKVLAGLTSLEEVLRLTVADE
ncbi:MAG: Flp pilus assembly complex ATPase component TadA [Candidatus Omnitrophica bacterium]|nr:Flp pilus assembly complex ATPase component TadA [Candidatus Omnitrophota bacterium]